MSIIAEPRLVVTHPDEATDYYQRALGARLDARYALPDGTIVQVELTIGESTITLTQEVAEWGLLAPATIGGSASLLTLRVDDARQVAERMVAAGGAVVVPIEDRAYGRCEGRVMDPFGHLWIPSHSIDVVDPSRYQGGDVTHPGD